AYAANLAIRDQLAALASEAGVTVAQLAIAWLLARDDLVIPIPGTRSVEHLTDNVGGAADDSATETLARAGELLNQHTVVGNRYAAAAAADIDSEAFAEAG